MTDAGNLTEQELDAFFESHPPSVGPYGFHFQGVGDEALCGKIVDVASSFVNYFSCLYPLQDLDGITYAADYPEALATLDRGVELKSTLTASAEKFGQGVAMAPAVKRDGRLKTHVVIAAKLGLDLLSEDPVDKELAVHTLVHELGHVVEHTLMEKAFPGAMLSPITDLYEGALFTHAHATWSEYLAERTSATFGPSFHAYFQELLEGAVQEQVAEIARVRAAVKRGDLGTAQSVGETTIAQVGKTMKFAGYLFGHADGRDVDPFLGRDGLKNLIKEHALTPWLEDVRDRLRTLFDACGNWASLLEHFTLNRALETGCRYYGVTLSRSPHYAVAWQVDFPDV